MYIGFTSRIPYKRFTEHREDSKTSTMPISRAIKKYGKINFLFDVIYCSADVQHCPEVMEPYFIEHYDTHNGGYNAHKGGRSRYGFKMPKEAVEKIRQAHIGRKIKQSARDAISKHWKIIHPDGKEESVFNLAEFARNNGLQDSLLTAVAHGRREHHKGYKCIDLSGNVKGKLSIYVR